MPFLATGAAWYIQGAMMSQDLGPLIAGVDDERHLIALRRMICNPRNDAQHTFLDAWDAIELVHCDGFEMLLEQSKPLEHYAAALRKIGLPQAQQVFARVQALISPHLLGPENQQELFEHLRGRFEEFKRLAYDFYDACVEFVPVVGSYVRQHRQDFCEYIGTNAPNDETRASDPTC